MYNVTEQHLSEQQQRGSSVPTVPDFVCPRQGCLFSPTLLNIFLERIMTDALEDHEGTVSIGGRTVTNLRFADDIDGLAGDVQITVM